MGFMSPWHWLIIAGAALLLFGNRLPDVARSMGRAINEFKRGLKDLPEDEVSERPGDKPDPERLKPGQNRVSETEPDDDQGNTSTAKREKESVK